MPDYSIRIYQMNFYIKKYFPELFYHFKKHQINPDIFFSKWILTIFSSYLPFPILAKVWDTFLVDKWKAIFKFSLCILKDLYPQIIKMDLNAISVFFREKSRTLHKNFQKLYKYSLEFKVTNKELKVLREDFFLNQVKKKLDVYIYF